MEEISTGTQSENATDERIKIIKQDRKKGQKQVTSNHDAHNWRTERIQVKKHSKEKMIKANLKRKHTEKLPSKAEKKKKKTKVRARMENDQSQFEKDTYREDAKRS